MAGSNSSINLPYGSIGQIVRSNGAGTPPSFTAATYPSTAGTSGNLLTSDGTNWNSTAPGPGFSGPGFISGYVYIAGNAAATSAGSIAVTTNDLWVKPWYIGNSTTISQIGINVNSASAAGKRARIGLYNSGIGKPTTLAIDFGTVLTDGTGWVNITGLSQALSPGWVYVGVQFEAAPTMIIFTAGSNYIPCSGGTTNSNFSSSSMIYSSTYSTGFPDLTAASPASFSLREILVEVKIT